jgi:hypothetical protein
MILFHSPPLWLGYNPSLTINIFFYLILLKFSGSICDRKNWITLFYFIFTKNVFHQNWDIKKRRFYGDSKFFEMSPKKCFEKRCRQKILRILSFSDLHIFTLFFAINFFMNILMAYFNEFRISVKFIYRYIIMKSILRHVRVFFANFKCLRSKL